MDTNTEEQNPILVSPPGPPLLPLRKSVSSLGCRFPIPTMSKGLSTLPSVSVYDSRIQAGVSSSTISERGPRRKFSNVLLFDTSDRKEQQADRNEGFLRKGTCEEESKFPLAVSTIPHLITILTEWLLPKKSHRKEISLKKCICIGVSCSLP